MKTILLIIFVMGFVCLSSCKEQTPESMPKSKADMSKAKTESLENTYWKGRVEFPDGDWLVDEMNFTSSIATYTYTSNYKGSWSFEAPYTYDPHTGVFVLKNEAVQPYPDGEWSIPDWEGKVTNNVMTFNVWESFDMRREAELKKQ